MSKKIILASKSPRRQELLKGMGFVFEVQTKDIEEIIPVEIQPRESAKYLAKLKAKMFHNLKNNEILITSDTIVLFENKVLGKPKNENEAKIMLQSLSGKQHEVISAVCIKTTKKEIIFDDTTKVYFKHFTDEELNYYIENYRPFDKAGSYGIQEWIGMIGMEKIEGSFYNVMGLPTHKLYSEFKKMI